MKAPTKTLMKTLIKTFRTTSIPSFLFKALIACAEQLPSTVTQDILVEVAQSAHDGQQMLYFKGKTMGDDRFKDLLKIHIKDFVYGNLF